MKHIEATVVIVATVILLVLFYVIMTPNVEVVEYYPQGEQFSGTPKRVEKQVYYIEYIVNE